MNPNEVARIKKVIEERFEALAKERDECYAKHDFYRATMIGERLSELSKIESELTADAIGVA